MVLEAYQECCQYIMVDKYQDTNIARFELVQLLAGKYRNICVIGDDDQSIFDAPPALAVGSVKS